MSDKYILDGTTPRQVDLMTWAKWSEDDSKRIVQQDTLPDGVKVSTVFLGLDHSFGMGGPPILWETMIFGGPHDDEQWRYTSHADALAGHATALELARSEAK